MVAFARIIELHAVPANAIVRLSADTRYKLLVNGSRICVGPTRGSTRIWYYDTIDLSKHLVVGKNVIRVDVARFYSAAFAAFTFGRTTRPGVTLIGTVGDTDISMGSDWTASVHDGLTFPVPPPYDFNSMGTDKEQHGDEFMDLFLNVGVAGCSDTNAEFANSLSKWWYLRLTAGLLSSPYDTLPTVTSS
jgi:hypothetical protein